MSWAKFLYIIFIGVVLFFTFAVIFGPKHTFYWTDLFFIAFMMFVTIYPFIRFMVLPEYKWKRFKSFGGNSIATVIEVKVGVGADPGDPDWYFPKLKFVYEGKEYIAGGDYCHNPVEVCDRIPIVFDKKNPKDFVYDPPFR